MSARAVGLVAAVVLVLGCPQPQPPPPEDDAGVPAVVVNGGPARGRGVPDLPADFVFDASIPLIDSGVIIVDRLCCMTNFSIQDREPPGDVRGTLVIALQAFAAGAPLARGGGRWTARACFPVNQSATCFYQFDLDGGLIDGGTVELDDGGVEGVLRLDLRRTRRASDEEPSVEQLDGTMANVFRAVSSCDGLAAR
ncbi:MAG: hypothetical protein INH41_08220 [Myxococcaceae bacterium]|jgi:hypothetical protein|nr:hypothetical protein [Myxococcaceae bacterium]